MNLQPELLDLSLVVALVFLKGEVVGFLLSVGENPLLHLLLVPVHLHLVLIHLLVALEDLVLQIIEPLLDLNGPIIQLLQVLLDPAVLSLGHLLQMILGLDLLVLFVDEGLGVQ